MTWPDHLHLLPVWIPSAVGIRQSSTVTPRQHTAVTAYSTSLHHYEEAEFGQPTEIQVKENTD